jgi:hypothetical protein
MGGNTVKAKTASWEKKLRILRESEALFFKADIVCGPKYIRKPSILEKPFQA